MFRNIIATIFAMLFLTGANAARNQQLSLPTGVWTSRGYGYVLLVEGNSTTTSQEVSLFDETAVSCIPNNELLVYIQGFNLVSDDLAEVDVGINVPYLFDRSDTFQSGCANGLTSTILDDAYIPDALEIYDIFVQTFDEHYAFFELRGVDWKSTSEQARTTVTTNTTSEALFSAMVSLVEPLKDGHVSIDTTEDYGYEKPSPLFQRFYQEFDNMTKANTTIPCNPPCRDPYQYSISQLEGWINNVAANYMDNGELKGDFFDGLVYGKFGSASSGSKSVGYIQMLAISYEDLGSTLEEYKAQLDVVFQELQSCDSIVVDHRFNTGGEDTTALLLASYFASERTFAYTQKAAVPGDNSFTEKQQVFIEPAPEEFRFKGSSAVVIVSEEDASAGETFAMAMKQLPHLTTLVGRNTAGELSAKLERLLPNGWIFSLSNEVHEAPDGTIYEMVGIPPDVIAPSELLPFQDRQAGSSSDSWLELALSIATLEETSAPTMSPDVPTPPAPPTGEPTTAAGGDSPTGAPTETDGMPSGSSSKKKSSLLVSLCSSFFLAAVTGGGILFMDW